jgi:periplasmic divalent cation tolerance protein
MASPLTPEAPAHSPSPVVIVLTTLPAAADAVAFARALVDEHLAACVSVGAEMQSVYRWQGSVEQDCERQIVVKTVRDMVGSLRTRMATLHPYEVPEFLVITAGDGGEAYLEWVRQSTRA